jgi:hypothetical protein
MEMRAPPKPANPWSREPAKRISIVTRVYSGITAVQYHKRSKKRRRALLHSEEKGRTMPLNKTAE